MTISDLLADARSHIRQWRDAVQLRGGSWLVGHVPIMPAWRTLANGYTDRDLHQLLMGTTDCGYGRVIEVTETHSTVAWAAKAGTRFEPHTHDVAEQVVMLRGRVRDLQTRNEVCPGQTLYYAARQPHALEIIEDAEYLVIWTPRLEFEVHDEERPEWVTKKSADVATNMPGMADLADRFVDPTIGRRQ